jgi:hypothetical protein
MLFHKRPRPEADGIFPQPDMELKQLQQNAELKMEVEAL